MRDMAHHLPLDGLQLVNLALDGAIAPVERQGSFDRLVILCEPFGKAVEFRNVGLVGGGDPDVEFCCATFTDKALKRLGKVVGDAAV